MTEAMPVVYSDRSRLEEVAPGAFRVDLPMPQVIGASNAYIFKADGVHDDGRSLIVDSGVDEAITRQCFDEALEQLGINWDSVDVFITHFHSDHSAGLMRIMRPGMTVYGGISSFGQRTVPVMGSRTMEEIEARVCEAHGIANNFDADYYLPQIKDGEGDFPITQLHEGDELVVGRYHFRVIEAPGHDLHHLCLYDQAASLFVSGDQVMDGVFPSVLLEDDSDQLQTMFDTLARLSSLEADLVLPGHGNPFSGVGPRCTAILEHYDRLLARFEPLCQEGITDIGELAYFSTQQPRRRPWAERSSFGRRSLISQTESFVRHLVATGKLPDIYDVVPVI